MAPVGVEGFECDAQGTQRYMQALIPGAAAVCLGSLGALMNWHAAIAGWATAVEQVGG